MTTELSNRYSWLISVCSLTLGEHSKRVIDWFIGGGNNLYKGRPRHPQRRFPEPLRYCLKQYQTERWRKWTTTRLIVNEKCKVCARQRMIPRLQVAKRARIFNLAGKRAKLILPMPKTRSIKGGQHGKSRLTSRPALENSFIFRASSLLFTIK